MKALRGNRALRRSLWSSTLLSPRAPVQSAQRQQWRFIGENSWGADGLRKTGEKLEPRDQKEILFTEDAIKTCPEHIKALGDEILMLNVIEISALLNRLQARLGISDDQVHSKRGGGGGGGGGGGVGGGAAAAAPAPAPAAVKETFDIKLTVVDAKAKIKIIKEVRVITGLGLAESKALVEKAPCVIKEGLKKDEVEKIRKLLVDAGAQVEVL